MTKPILKLRLHPKQWLAMETPATEVLYGGAAGGGKSHLMRVAAIRWCVEIAGLQVYFFRRIREDLIKNHMEGPQGLRALLAPLVDAGWCEIIENEVRFWNHSKIFLCHAQHETDVYKYQGAEIHVLCVDELTHFAEPMYRFLRNRVRMVGLDVPADYSGRFPRILASANPGGVGHLWVKNTFIDGVTPLKMRLQPSAEGGMRRMYIPATLDDNPSMLEHDPGYEARLEGLGSKALVAAMRWGDWNVIEGAFFDCWSPQLHVLAPFSVPLEWLRFRSADWGAASPFSTGWWAVVQEDYFLPVVKRDSRGTLIRTNTGALEDMGFRRIPRGALIRYREDYGDQEGAPGKGLKLTAEAYADRIIAREKGDETKCTYGVMDPSTFKVDGGPSIAERVNRKLVQAGLAPFREADNRRVNTRMSRDRGGPMSGWDVVRQRMVGTNGVPDIYCFSTCIDSIRTIPALQHDPDRAEDLNTRGEDHAADEWRYACMSRAWLKEREKPPVPKQDYGPPSEQIPTDSFKLL